ncbi:Ribosomal protein L10e/L16 [Penicillium concentricum]|uniref:Ribosomal protein L10e/L16 n=1 Tax=Penicillium concentricum TaxID=293559 RepID=A0A9W9VLW8_9EURO|nr:Ribosomal protein L10e/L16 [Penicillium concentricum]KAJ5385528.1 Ribosomal protein L10e/L16 [Penicillium concentricum]
MVTDGDDLGSLPSHVHGEHDHSNYNEMGKVDDDDGDEQGDERSEDSEDEREPCMDALFAVSVRSVGLCVNANGHATNDTQSRSMRKPPTREEEHANDVMFCTTRTATETVSQLLNCIGRSCTQDPSMLLVLGSVLLKVLSCYEALYESEIGRLVVSNTPLPNGCEDMSSRRHHSDSSQSGDQHSTAPSQPSESTKYTVPLTIPLTTGVFNLSRATETKVKAQLLLCEVQTLSQVCQALYRRV